MLTSAAAPNSKLYNDINNLVKQRYGLWSLYYCAWNLHVWIPAKPNLSIGDGAWNSGSTSIFTLKELIPRTKLRFQGPHNKNPSPRARATTNTFIGVLSISNSVFCIPANRNINRRWSRPHKYRVVLFRYTGLGLYLFGDRLYGPYQENSVYW